MLATLTTGNVLLAQERPGPPPRGEQPPPRPRERGNRYSIEQATSDRAQLHTIAFDGLAFLTGDFAGDTFLPPGKVSDYFGFQYMRDIDAKEGGHNTSFLTRIAHNMLAVLNQDQKAQLLALGPLTILPSFRSLTASLGGGAIRSLGPVFIRSQPSIPIRVQFSQGCGSVRNLIRIDHPILVGVQDPEDRGNGARLTRGWGRPILGLNQASQHEKCVGKSGHDGLPCSMITGEIPSHLLRSDPSGLTRSICRSTRQESWAEPE